MNIKYYLYVVMMMLCAVNISAQEMNENDNFANVVLFENASEMRQFMKNRNINDVFACNDPVGNEDMILVIPYSKDIRLELFRYNSDEYGNKEPNYEMSLGVAETAQPMYFVAPDKGSDAGLIVEAVDGYGRRAWWCPKRDEKGRLMENDEFIGIRLADRNDNRQSIDTDYGVRILNENGKVIFDIYDIEKYRKFNEWSLIKTPLNNGKYDVLNPYGTCKKIFIGDIGQDVNPILCMLYENGTVSIMNVMDAIKKGFFICSSPLNGFSGIKDFVSDGGGGYMDELGREIYEYRTIYTVDSNNIRKEIEPFCYGGGAFFESNGHMLYLYEDKTITYYNYNEDVYRMYTGTFDFKEVGTDIYEISYNIVLYINMNIPDSEFEKTDIKGKFRLDRSDWDSMIIKSYSGFTFGGEKGSTVTLRQVHNE